MNPKFKTWLNLHAAKLGAALFVIGLVFALSLCSAHADPAGYAQANSISCPAAGSSIQVLAANYTRQSFLLTNTSGSTVRVGFLASGTANLDDTNSLQLLAGQTFGDSGSSVYIGRIVCMSTTAGALAIYAVETRRAN